MSVTLTNMTVIQMLLVQILRAPFLANVTVDTVEMALIVLKSTNAL